MLAGPHNRKGLCEGFKLGVRIGFRLRLGSGSGIAGVTVRDRVIHYVY